MGWDLRVEGRGKSHLYMPWGQLRLGRESGRERDRFSPDGSVFAAGLSDGAIRVRVPGMGIGEKGGARI